MKSILIVDAEPTVRSVVAKILTRAGYQMREADSLDSALDQLSTSRMDLIITNVYLPGIAGHDAVHSLKTKGGATPILMVSGLPDSEVIDKWQSQDGWDVFPKPFAADALVNKVEQVLSQWAAEKNA